MTAVHCCTRISGRTQLAQHNFECVMHACTVEDTKGAEFEVAFARKRQLRRCQRCGRRAPVAPGRVDRKDAAR
jgi:hypothetical protein